MAGHDKRACELALGGGYEALSPKAKAVLSTTPQEINLGRSPSKKLGMSARTGSVVESRCVGVVTPMLRSEVVPLAAGLMSPA